MKEFLAAQKERILFATISGAHLYGFESPDSDVDLRGAFVLPLDDVIGMREPKETLTVSTVLNGVEMDYVAHDVLKFCQLMTRRNGYVLEQLYSPHIVIGGPLHDELRHLGTGCCVRHVHYHYKGFLKNQLDILKKSDPTVKALLYAYRVALTGIHFLQTGRIEAHLPTLTSDREITELIERKRAGKEFQQLNEGELQHHDARLQKLEEELQDAFEVSTLPEEVSTRDALSDFVVKVRKQ